MWLKALREQRVDLRNAVAITVLVLACLRDNLKWCIQMGAKAACAQLHTTEAISWHLLMSPNWHTANYISTHARRRPTLATLLRRIFSLASRRIHVSPEDWNVRSVNGILVSVTKWTTGKAKGRHFCANLFCPSVHKCVCLREKKAAEKSGSFSQKHWQTERFKLVNRNLSRNSDWMQPTDRPLYYPQR